MSMTRAQVRTEVQKLAPEGQRTTSTSGVGSELETLINNMQMKVAQDTECLRKDLAQVLTDDVGEYTQTSVIVRIVNAYFYDVSAGTKTQLGIRDEKWLDENYAGWRTAEESTPLFVYSRNNVVGLYPEPDTTSDYLYLNIVCLPDSFSSDTQELWTLDGSTTYQIPSLDWMVIYLCAENIKRERGFNDKADVFANHQNHTGLYYDELGKILTNNYIKHEAKREDRLNFYSYAKKFGLR